MVLDQWWLYGGPGGQGARGPWPSRCIFLVPLLTPTFLERYKMLCFDYIFTANTHDLGRCTKKEHDTLD